MPKKPLSKKAMDNSSNDFESMYEANQPLIYRFMFWRTKDEMVSQDLTSHVFEKAWRTRKSFTGGSAKAWLFQIARTTLIDYWRKTKDITDNDISVNQAESSATPIDAATDQAMLVERLKTAVTKLPKDMQRVVELRFINGLSARQTGDKLGLSEANVRVIQYRALKKLRNYL